MHLLQYHKLVGQSGGNENYNIRYQNKSYNSQCLQEEKNQAIVGYYNSTKSVVKVFGFTLFLTYEF